MKETTVITKNDIFSSGIVKYVDESGNIYFFKKNKDNDGFVGKLRFVNKNVRIEPIRVSFPIDESLSGFHLKMDFLDGVNREKEPYVKKGLEEFTELIIRWAHMIMDINMFQSCNNTVCMANKNGIKGIDETTRDETAIWKLKLNELTKYEELKSLLSAFEEK